jgi:N-glycosylase/DNA lyase
MDEVGREVQVRARCFPRWISEGRVSKSDAEDRLRRLCKAKDALEKVVALDESQANPKPF